MEAKIVRKHDDGRFTLEIKWAEHRLASIEVAAYIPSKFHIDLTLDELQGIAISLINYVANEKAK